MFENLKAFIRHGKQANDLKQNHHNKKDLNYTTYSSSPTTIDPITATTANANITNANAYATYNQQQAHLLDQNNNNYDINNYNNASHQQNGVYNNYNYSSSDTTLYNQNSHNNNQDYNHQIASKLVEEENLQKQTATKYPGLDNYQILDQMGEGAFSVVYKAKYLPTGKEVAIKILRKFQMDQQQKQAVLKEVTIMRQLNHKHTVRFIEFIDSPKYYYIVQELVSGGEIFTMIVKYTYLSEDLSRWIIVQVAQAIRYLHEEVGIVHRDIKPENLLFEPIDYKPSADPISKLRKSDDPNSKKDEGDFVPGYGGGGIGIVKLADFGLSKQIWEHNTKTPCGTVGYTAPEIVRDERYSKEVDMWAIGCVLYTLLCGFPPFYDERIETLTEKVAKGQFTFLQPWWDEISDGAKHCVSKLLTVDPRKRYTIDEFLNDPWILKESTSAVSSHLSGRVSNIKTNSHPIQSHNASTSDYNKYSKKYKKASTNQDLYSPAAVALRDAFDISTAVHRMGEEAALAGNKIPSTIEDLVEEEEEEDDELEDSSGRVLSSRVPRSAHGTDLSKHRNHIKSQASRAFDLNLGGASIIERRKNKIPIQG